MMYIIVDVIETESKNSLILFMNRLNDKLEFAESLDFVFSYEEFNEAIKRLPTFYNGMPHMGLPDDFRESYREYIDTVDKNKKEKFLRDIVLLLNWMEYFKGIRVDSLFNLEKCRGLLLKSSDIQ